MSLKESDIAKIIINWFEGNGYTIYKEVVNTGSGKNRADIIAVKNGEYTVIETKVSFGLTVIEQGFKWSEYSHYRYIGLPYSSKRNSRTFGYNICRDLGIGVIEVDKHKNVRIVHESAFTKTPNLPPLYEEQKYQEAGVKPTKDSYVTPFKFTCRELIKYVKDNGDTSLLSVIKKINHHYKSDSSAQNALIKLIKIGVLPELEIYKDGRTTCVRLSSRK